jgi:hypothetical protein
MATETWTLTDVERDVWQEKFSISSADLKLPPEVTWSISKRTLRGGLCDGVDLIELHNAALALSIVPTRGMGIWKGNYRGLALGWDAPVRGPVHPKFVNPLDRGGIGWLQGFDEWIVRCGLDSNGAPGEDVVLDNNGNPMKVNLLLHGKIANLPAHFVEIEAQTEPPYEIAVTGRVEESALFCPQLELRTRISTRPGSNRLTIADEVVNLKSTESELELLYHCNFGPPFLDPGARLVAPAREVSPRDPRAVEGIGHFDTYLGPTAGYVEQVYWYDLAADARTHQTLAALRNSTGDRAAVLRYDKRQLPCFTQWKNTGALQDGYVTGLEPGTNFPNPRRFERERGRVLKIEPGKSYRCLLDVEICSTSDQVAAVERQIAALSASVQPTIHPKPHPRYSPV